MIDMDYEKKYNEALKRAEAAINIAADKDLVKGVATTIFPELRESEDERIRKAIIHYILYETKGNISESTEHVWVTWLEKQKECVAGSSKTSASLPQPKVELSEDVKKTLDEVSHILIGLNYKQIAKDYKQAIEKLLHPDC